MNQKSRRLGLLFISLFVLTFTVLAQFTPRLIVQNRDSFVTDANGDGLADPNDVIRYTVVIANCESTTAEGVVYNAPIDENTTLNAGSITTSGIQSIDSAICGEPVFDPPDATPVPPTPVIVDADAIDDAISVTNDGTTTDNIIGNDLGQAPIQVLSFGDSLANVGTTPADGATVLQIAAGGGTIDITIDADGNIGVTSNGTTGTGSVTIFYEIQAGNGTTDVAEIIITFGDFPTAEDDTLATLGAGNEYTTSVSVALNVGAGTGLLNNDTLGTPAATLTNWGGGDASANVDSDAGTSRPFVGGTLTVNADGSFDLVNPTTPGVFTFDYILDNGIGTSQGTVEIYVEDPPIAEDDAVNASVAQVTNFPAPALFDDNGSGADYLGAPPATLVSFGGGSFGGAVTDNAAGSTIAIPVLSGNLTVNGDGSFTVDTPTATGIFTFEYQIDNGVGTDTAIVTVTIVATPVTQDDAFGVGLGLDLIGGDLTADNGNGADDLGTPPFDTLTFGGGDLGGTVTSNTATSGGTSVPLAGGTITITDAGLIDLVGAITAGTYTFEYQLTNTNGTSNISTVTITVDEAITVTSTTPTDTAAGVDIADDIEITFSEVPSLNGSWFSIVCDTSNITTANSVVSTATNTVTINPNTDFILGESCTVTILSDATNGVTDADVIDPPDLLDGNGDGTTGDNYVFTFTTTDALPTLTTAEVESGGFVSTIPTATQVQNDTDIRLTFSEEVNFAADAVDVNCSTSGIVTGDYTAGATPASIITLTYGGAGLADGETCTVTLVSNFISDNDGIAPTLFDGNGNNIEEGSPTDNLLFQFTVDVGPSVNSVQVEKSDVLGDLTTPPNDTDVDLDTTIVINFSEEMDVPTTSNWVTVICPSATYNILGTSGGNILGVSGDNTATLTLTPPVNFPVNETCTITVFGNLVADLDAGDPPNNLASNYSDSFTTVNTLPPNAVNDGVYTMTVGGTLTINTTDPNDLLDNDDQGIPQTQIDSFGGGDIVGSTLVTDFAAPNSTTLAGGTLQVNADGSFSLTNPTTSGTVTFLYRLENTAGFSDATVTVTIESPPTAVNDPTASGLPNTSAPGDAFHTPLNTTIEGSDTSTAGTDVGLMNNDNRGFPLADVVSFTNLTTNDGAGGFNAPDTTVYAAGNTATVATTGSLTVTADGSFTFVPPTDYTGLFTFDYTIQNALVSSTATVTIGVGVRPTAVNDTYNSTVIGNIAIDTDLISNFTVLTNDGGDIPTFASSSLTSVEGGDVTIETLGFGSTAGPVYGSFIYNPPVGYEGPDSFTYTIQNGFGSVTGTVNLAVNEMVWFVDNSATGAGDGRFGTPFQDFGGAGNSFNVVATDEINDYIFIYTGSAGASTGTPNPANPNAYDAGVTLLNNQTLFGDGITSTFATFTGLTIPADSVVPTISNDAPIMRNTGGDALTLASGNTLSGFIIGDTAAANHGIVDGGGTVGTLNISDMQILGTGGLVEIDNGGNLDVTFNTLTSTSTTGIGIDLAGVGGTQFVVQNATAITQTGGNSSPISIANASNLAIDISDGSTVTVTNRRNTGFFVDNKDGSTLTVGNYTDANGAGATGYAIRIVNSTSSVDFDQTNVANAVIGTLQTQAADYPTNDGDGDNIFLKDNPSPFSFTSNGGLIDNAQADNVDVRSSNSVRFFGVIIEDASANQVAVYNGTGTHEIRDSIIRNFAVTGAPPTDGLGVLYRNNTGTLNVVFDGNNVNANSTGSTIGGIGLLVEAEGTSNLDVDLIDGGGVGTSLFTNHFGASAQLVADGGTMTTLVSNTRFQNSEGTGSGALVLNANNNGTHTFTVQNNTLTNLGNLDSASGILAFSSFNNATMRGTVNGNNLSNTDRNMIQVQTESGASNVLDINGNTLNDQNAASSINRAAIFISSVGAGSADYTIRNNNIGTTTLVGNEGIVLTGNPTGTVEASITGNTIGSVGRQLEGRGIALDLPNAGNYQITADNNTIVAGSNASSFRVDIAIEVEGSATACINATGNSLNGDSIFVVDEAGPTSVIDVSTHADPGALGTANGGATVNGGGTRNFSQPACATPSLP